MVFDSLLEVERDCSESVFGEEVLARFSRKAPTAPAPTTAPAKMIYELSNSKPVSGGFGQPGNHQPDRGQQGQGCQANLFPGRSFAGLCGNENTGLRVRQVRDQGQGSENRSGQ